MLAMRKSVLWLPVVRVAGPSALVWRLPVCWAAVSAHRGRPNTQPSSISGPCTHSAERQPVAPPSSRYKLCHSLLKANGNPKPGVSIAVPSAKMAVWTTEVVTKPTGRKDTRAYTNPFLLCWRCTKVLYIYDGERTWKRVVAFWPILREAENVMNSHTWTLSDGG